MDFGKPYHGTLVGNEHHFAVRVYIEDTDLGGVVYHANYLRYLERARSDLLRVMGIDQRGAIERGEGVYAVTEAQIQYRRPARLDDELIVLTRVSEVGGASCSLTQKIMRGRELIAEAVIKVAFLGGDGRPKRHPAAWADKFRRLESAPPHP